MLASSTTALTSEWTSVSDPPHTMRNVRWSPPRRSRRMRLDCFVRGAIERVEFGGDRAGDWGCVAVVDRQVVHQ